MDTVIGILDMLSGGITGVAVAGVTMILMALALIRHESWIMVLAAILLIPVAYAAGAWSGFLIAVRLMPVLLLLAALAIDQDEVLFSWLLPLFPFGYLGYYIFNLLVSNFRGF